LRFAFSRRPGGVNRDWQGRGAQHALQPEGRMCVVIDDGSEDIEARIARCKVETDLSSRDLLVIRKHLFGLRSVEIQDSTRRVFVIQALNGAIRTD
jgi:hypothetical protein